MLLKIGIFGSFANNEASDEGDIDLLVELYRPTGWNYFTLQIYLESIFGRKVDLVTKSALKEQIRDSILSQDNYAKVKKDDRNYTVYLQDLLVAMSRIAEYLDGYTFDQFKKDY